MSDIVTLYVLDKFKKKLADLESTVREAGPEGPKGSKGDKGDKGDKGPKDPRGPTVLRVPRVLTGPGDQKDPRATLEPALLMRT